VICTTATIERPSLGPKYVLASSPWQSLQGHTTIWNLVNGTTIV
jgi:hypothetical protein